MPPTPPNANSLRQQADAGNFRSDYNLDGFIDSADATIVRAHSGNWLP